MRTKFYLLGLSILFSLNLFAAEINQQKAEKVALNFYTQKFNEAHFSNQTIRIVNAEEKADQTQNAFYVFHFNAGGYVMVSAESSMTPILAYSLENNNNYVVTKSRSVEPLVTTRWNQGWPYNSMCPINDEGQAVTGCVATGYAQLLYYWRFPIHGSGDHCYYHSDYGQLCADFENTWYQWDAMTDAPKINDTAVGELMYHLGVALDMDYGPDGSGTWQYPEQIEQHFNVSPDLSWNNRDSYNDTQWKNLLKNQLDQAYPMGYVGYSNSGGHFWVCDGYDSEDFFHMNWGWGGSSDGYFHINNMQDFTYGHSVSVNFYPDTDNWTYPNYATGADTLKYLEGSISDGSGPVDNYLENTTATWLIDPQSIYDSISSITLTLKQFDVYEDGDVLNVYAGADNNAELILSLSGPDVEGELEVMSKNVFLEFISNGSNNAAGFYLNYKANKAAFCVEMNQITESSAVIKDGSDSFYYANNAFCIWVIDPGVSSPLTLHFNEFDTELNNDVLKIYDGSNQQLLVELSGSDSDIPASVTSPSGKINMVFVTNSSVQKQGWEVWYDINTSTNFMEQDFAFQIIPNPVSSQVQFQFNLNTEEAVNMEILDMLGHVQKTITHQVLEAGNHSISSDLEQLTEGVYFCRLQIGNKIVTKKVLKVN
ncbi:MAG: hypothetical protein B7C24_00250 [Bacteroidetes bacterium 4572_77]|nr:MAG: hypothetical protein B7C24_00250 [Bacteroidetes bacterium 4572_77]